MGFFRSHYGKENHNKNGWYCEYKNKQYIHYETQKKAETALKYVNEYDDPDYVPVRAYFCQCGYWHLTSKPNKKLVA